MVLVILYFCPEAGAWSHQECSCPGTKDDEVHAAYQIDDSEAAVAQLINLMYETYADIRDGEDSEPTMERIADTYLELTGSLI